MKIMENGKVREMTAEEIAAVEKQAEIQAAVERTRSLTEVEVTRMLLEQQINTLSVDDATSSRMADYFPAWESGIAYTAGFRVRYNGNLYKCTQSHTSQSDWTPAAAPSLWDAVQYRNGYRVIPETISAAGAFALGEYGWWGDHLYKSTIASNVWTPEAYPTGWEEVL